MQRRIVIPIPVLEGFQRARRELFQGQIQLVRGFKPVEAKALTDYKVPSLKGVWCRGHYLHEGSAASLEEMFDLARLEETHVPGAWLPPDHMLATAEQLTP